MSTFTLQVPNSQVGWFEEMIRTMGWAFTRTVSSDNKVSEKPEVITPALRRRINTARKEYAAGQTVSCKNPQEMQRFFDSL